MAYEIDNYGNTANPILDITGSPLGILLNFQAKGTAAPKDYPLALIEGFLPNLLPTDQGLLQSLLTMTQVPLSQLLDQMWSGTRDQNGQTLRDKAAANIIGQIQSQQPSAYDITASLPAAGALRAVVLSAGVSWPDDHQIIYLSYELSGISARFTLPGSAGGFLGSVFGAVFGNPVIDLTVDIELLVGIGVPTVSDSFTLTASTFASDANVSGGNLSGNIAQALAVAFKFLQGQPPPNQAIEGQIDASGSSYAIDITPIQTMLTQLSAALIDAKPAGFTTPLFAFIDGGARTLNLRLTHPVDQPPVVSNAAVPDYPNLFPPLIRPSFPLAQLDGTLTITGSGFPPGQAESLYIAWDDTTSGLTTESDVQWGKVGGPSQTMHLTRTPNDGKNQQVFANLTPQTAYQFTVQDQDLVTETGFGPATTITTDSSDAMDLILQPAAGGGQRYMVGHTVLQPTGGFNAKINLMGVPKGTYVLAAVHAGVSLATCDIEIVTTLKASLVVATRVLQGSNFLLEGAGFEPGTVTLYLDSASGQILGTVQTSDGNFDTQMLWPATIGGQHEIVAQELVNGQPLVATATVTPETPPR